MEEKLKTLSDRLDSLEQEKVKLLKELQQELYKACKEKYEGNLITTDNHTSRFKVRKVVKVTVGDNFIIMYVTGNGLTDTVILDNTPISLGYSSTLKGFLKRFYIDKNGLLTQGTLYTFSSDIAKFDDDFKNWRKRIEKFYDKKENFIKYRSTEVFFLDDDGEMTRGYIDSFVEEQEQFKIGYFSTKTNKMEHAYRFGKDILLV